MIMNIPSQKDIEKILLNKNQIKKKVVELAGLISEDYKNKEIYAVIVLKGAENFAHDLISKINLRIPIIKDYFMLSSYGNAFESSGKVKVVLDLGQSIKNKDVLIIEDIIDSGFTLNYLLTVLEARGPNSIKVSSLLNKPTRKPEFKDLKIDYLGFNIPNYFVVGYGLDYCQYCRNWPFIAVLKEEFYQV